MAAVAREWHVLPSVAARDLDEDPEQLSLVCLDLVRYSQVHAAWKSGNKDAIKPWEGSEVLDAVKENDFELAAAAIAGRKEE